MQTRLLQTTNVLQLLSSPWALLRNLGFHSNSLVPDILSLNSPFVSLLGLVGFNHPNSLAKNGTFTYGSRIVGSQPPPKKEVVLLGPSDQTLAQIPEIPVGGCLLWFSNFW